MWRAVCSSRRGQGERVDERTHLDRGWCVPYARCSSEAAVRSSEPQMRSISCNLPFFFLFFSGKCGGQLYSNPAGLEGLELCPNLPHQCAFFYKSVQINIWKNISHQPKLKDNFNVRRHIYIHFKMGPLTLRPVLGNLMLFLDASLQRLTK